MSVAGFCPSPCCPADLLGSPSKWPRKWHYDDINTHNQLLLHELTDPILPRGTKSLVCVSVPLPELSLRSQRCRVLHLHFRARLRSPSALVVSGSPPSHLAGRMFAWVYDALSTRWRFLFSWHLTGAFSIRRRGSPKLRKVFQTPGGTEARTLEGPNVRICPRGNEGKLLLVWRGMKEPEKVRREAAAVLYSLCNFNILSLN